MFNSFERIDPIASQLDNQLRFHDPNRTIGRMGSGKLFGAGPIGGVGSSFANYNIPRSYLRGPSEMYSVGFAPAGEMPKIPSDGLAIQPLRQDFFYI